MKEKARASIMKACIH